MYDPNDQLHDFEKNIFHTNTAVSEMVQNWEGSQKNMFIYFIDFFRYIQTGVKLFSNRFNAFTYYFEL